MNGRTKPILLVLVINNGTDAVDLLVLLNFPTDAPLYNSSGAVRLLPVLEGDEEEDEIFVLARTKESIRGIISVAMHARLSIQSSKDSFGNDGGSELWRAATAERVPTQLLVLI